MNYVLFAVLAVMWTIALTMAPSDVLGSRPLISAYNVVLILFFVYIVLPIFLLLIDGTNYYWAPSFSSPAVLSATIKLCIYCLLVFVVIYRILSEKAINRAAAVPLKEHDKRRNLLVSETFPVTGVTWTLLLIGLGIKLYLVLTSGGFADSAIRQSAGARSTSGVQLLASSQISLQVLSGIADAAAVWILASSLSKSTKLSKLRLLIVFLIIALSFLSGGKRLTLLLPLLVVAISYHLSRHRLSARLVPAALVASLGLGMATLFFRIFVPAKLTGSQINLGQLDYAKGSLWRFYFYSLEFSTAQMIGVAQQAIEPLRSEFGGSAHGFFVTNLVPFSYVVPRAIWTGKPQSFTDVSYGIASLLQGIPLSGASAGYASTIIGTSYVIGGLIGSTVAMVFLSIFCFRVDRSLTKSAWTSKNLFLFAFLVNVTFHLFRQGTLGWVFIIAVVQQAGFVVGIVVLLVSARPKKAAEQTAPMVVTPTSAAASHSAGRHA